MPPRAPRAPRPELPLVARARAHADRTAIAAADGTFTYRELLDASAGVATCLLAGRADLAEARVAFLAPAGFRHVATQWGIWRAGGVAVPLAVSHPPPELEYVIRDAEAEIVVVHPDLAGSLEGVRLPPAVRTVTTHEAVGTTPHSSLPGVAEGRRAMMVYTSGATRLRAGASIRPAARLPACGSWSPVRRRSPWGRWSAGGTSAARCCSSVTG